MSSMFTTHTDNYMPDPVDRASAEELRFRDIQAQAICMNLRLQAAQGEEMYCCDCGEEIPIARRRAVPGVRRCISCQETAEATRH